MCVEDGEVRKLVLGDANPPLPKGVHEVPNGRLGGKVRDMFKVDHKACPMLLVTHQSVIREASAPFRPPRGAKDTPWSEDIVQRTMGLRDVTGVGFLAVTTSAPGAAAKPRTATTAAATEAGGCGQPAAEGVGGTDGHGSGGHGSGGGGEGGRSGSGASGSGASGSGASGSGASGTGGSGGGRSAGPGGKGGKQHTLPFNLQDSTLELQAACYEVRWSLGVQQTFRWLFLAI